MMTDNCLVWQLLNQILHSTSLNSIKLKIHSNVDEAFTSCSSTFFSFDLPRIASNADDETFNGQNVALLSKKIIASTSLFHFYFPLICYCRRFTSMEF